MFDIIAVLDNTLWEIRTPPSLNIDYFAKDIMLCLDFLGLRLLLLLWELV